MSEWRAQLFGTFALYRERELVEVPVAISRNVLAYLLLSDGPVSREVLASELWPDSDPAESRNLISQSLWKLKRSIGEERFGELIHANSHSISIGADVETDIRSFSELMSEAERGAAGERVALMEATRLCRGELLEDVFDDWAIARQRQYRWQIIDALERLHLLFAAEGDYMSALQQAHRLVEIDPSREDMHQTIMKTLHLLGRSGEAIRYYNETFDGMAEWMETRQLFRAIESQRPPDPPVESVDFVGRTESLSQAVDALSPVMGSVGAMVTVTGEVGIGKTAFLTRLEHQLYWRGFRVIRHGCQGDAGRAYGTAVSIVEALVAARGSLGLDLSVPDDLLDAARTLIPSLGAVQAEPASVDNPTLRMHEALIAVIVAAASPRPTVIILDDAAAMDPDSISLFPELADRLLKAGVGVVLATTGQSIGDDMDMLMAAGESVHIPRFRLDDTVAFLERQWGPVDRDTTRRLHHESGGLPLFLTLLSEGASVNNLGDAVEIRLAGLTDESRRVFDLLSLEPAGLRSDLVERLLRDQDELDSLAEAGLVVEESGTYRIEPAGIRPVAQSLIERPAELHRVLAVALAESDADLEIFVTHAAAAGLSEAAALTHLWIAQQAVAVSASERAQVHFAEAVRLGTAGALRPAALWAAVAEFMEFLTTRSLDTDLDLDVQVVALARSEEEQVRSLLLAADLLRVRGEYAQAIELVQQAVARATDVADIGRSALIRATIRRLQGRALVGVEEIDQITTAHEFDPLTMARLERNRAMMLVRLNRNADAAESIERALELAEGDLLLQAEVLNAKALRALESGELEAAAQIQDQIFDMSERAGHRYLMGVSRWNTSVVRLNGDLMAPAIESGEEALRFGQEVGSTFLTNMGRLSLASALYETTGPSALLDDLLTEAKVFARRHKVVNAEWWANELDALVASDRGNRSEAFRLIDRVIEALESEGLDWGLLNAYLTMAIIHVDNQEWTEALGCVDLADESRAKVDSVTHVWPALALRAIASAEVGDLAVARRCAEQAMSMDPSWYSRHRSAKFLADTFRLLGEVERYHEALDLAYGFLQRRLEGLPREFADRGRRTETARAISESWMLTRPHVVAIRSLNVEGLEIMVDVSVSLPTDASHPAGPDRRRARLGRIRSQLQAAGVSSLPLSEIAQLLGVSESTVRRDLTTLGSRQ